MNKSLEKGIYIGKDFEAVITLKFTLVFLKKNKSLYSLLLRSEDFSCIHLVKTTSMEKDGVVHMDYMISQQGGMNYVKGENYIKYKDKVVFNVYLEQNQVIWEFIEKDIFETTQYQKFDDMYLTPVNIKANGNNLGECIKKWNLGVRVFENYFNGKYYFNGIEINTPEHMYLYKVSYEYVYTRSARFATCNLGVVFRQIYRQSFHGTESSIYHINTDYKEISKEEIIIDSELFKDNSCNVKNTDIYWSIKKYDEVSIVVNGCQGEEYVFKNPY